VSANDEIHVFIPFYDKTRQRADSKRLHEVMQRAAKPEEKLQEGNIFCGCLAASVFTNTPAKAGAYTKAVERNPWPQVCAS
jgi:hypothetical protein